MPTDRWLTLERLYHAALERPAEERTAFLVEACKDETLRREVLALLEQPSMPDFLGGPAIAVAAAMVDEVHASQWIGRRIGVYHLQSLLGKGGMGEVYRARDTRLGRDVAVKVLPRAFTADPDRLARFEREARVLASLNHPHIGAIHGLEESEGVQALVLELVEGETLADRLHLGAVAIPDALAIARQIADALEAAHDKGIVHRDLKPSNIKITPDGVVKVLDFGLAKGGTEVSGHDLTQSPTISIGNTHDGVILGTAPYMSPEQARGQAVDKRTDIWAFGCVLYELLTGRTAFAGATVSDTIATILQREPDWTALPATLPSGVTTLLHRCLEKDVRRRKRDIGDARAELDEAIARPVVSEVRLDASGRPTRRHLLPWAVALTAVATAVVGFWPRAAPPAPWQNPLANAKFTPFTNFSGTETDAAISPDGRFVAFLADRDGQFGIWLSQVGTGRFTPLTPRDVYGPLGASSRSIGFTPDGTEIWISGTPRGRRLQLLPLIGGGTARPFLVDGAQNVSWAPDGNRIVYSTPADGDPFFVADRVGANPTQIHVSEPGQHNHGPIWSPDGQWIYFAHGIPRTEEMDAWRIRSSGGEAEPLTQNTVVGSLAPLDERTLLYVARADDGSGPWLWALDVNTKVSHRVSSGLEQYTSIAASADGRRLVASVASPRAGLWSVPILDRPVVGGEVQPYRLPAVRALAPRVRGTSLFYLSALGTADGLWRFKDGQSLEIWPGSQGALLEPPAVSPDGLRVVVALRKGGKRYLMVVAADGAESRTLGESIDVRGTADWSPDGAWVVTGGIDEKGPGLFKIPVDGGAPVRLASGQASDPVWSSDGNLIIYAGPNVAAQAPLMGVRPDGAAVVLPPAHVAAGTARHRFLPDGSGVVFLQGGIYGRSFWLLHLASKSIRQLADLTSETDLGDIEAFDVTPDGKRIIFGRSSDNSDIVLIDLPPR